MPAKIECALTRVGIIVSTVAFALACSDFFAMLRMPGRSLAFKAELLVFVGICATLLYGNFVYQFCRLGYWRRLSAQRAESRSELDAVYHGAAPKVAILIPSFREEPHILKQTVMSAALAEYPDRRVVVLIDDPPRGNDAAQQALDRTRRLIRDLNTLFAGQARRVWHELWVLRARKKAGTIGDLAEGCGIAALYDDVASWLEAQARTFEAESKPAFAHSDALFVREILRAPAMAHRRRAAELRRLPPTKTGIALEYERLAAAFDVEIAAFERKQYENLSHRPNKAMNLNAYIGLIGGSYRLVRTEHGRASLEEFDGPAAALRVPSADYVLTLDADSLIRPDYILRLARIMQRDDRTAVVQTPYSAVPGAPTPLERIAGATTDVQYIIHQGFTKYEATYWVGANALIRLKALRDICIWEEERGYRVPVFIQDRTVIEDTGSTLDLIRRGWTLHNYPERLAYSATPPDFGSLIIQRRRWSNGGLIIFADLARYARALQPARSRMVECLIRAHYLLSPALANFGLLALLFYPFDLSLMSLWLPLGAVPYYYLYGRDMVGCGYRWADLPRVYALNLLLLPVNLAGVLRSIQQAMTGRKSAFGRTPKIEGRTAVPAFHVLVQYGILGYLVAMLIADLALHRFAHAIFCAINIGFWLYAMVAFVGLRESLMDVRARFRRDEAAHGMAPAIDRSARLAGAKAGRRGLAIPSLDQGRKTARDSAMPSPAVPARLREATPDPGAADF